MVHSRRSPLHFAAMRVAVLLARLLPRYAASGRLRQALVMLMSVMRVLPVEEKHRVQVEQLREAFASGHPAIKVAERVVQRCHPKFLQTIVRNLWMGWYDGATVRRQFIDREGFEPPNLAVISPAKVCNLKCEGCYASAVTTKDEPQLDFDTVDRIVTELKSFGVSFIVFSGGEPTHPMVWPTIKRICEKHRDQAFMMYTNGTLLNDEKVDDLLRLGNLSPAISVEGWEEETDARRGKGVYEKVMAAMDRLREAGVPFGFSLTYTRRNFEVATSARFIQHLMDKGASYGWYFMYVPVGRDPDVSLVVTPEERDKIRQFTWDILREKGLFIADFWNSGPMSKGCLAGGRYLHINNKGDIEPCVFFRFATHNIHECRIIDALRSRLFVEIRKSQAGQRNPLAPCQFMDHPYDGKRAVELSGARATDEDGETLFKEPILPFLDRFSREYAKHYAEPAWLKSGEYAWFAHVYDAPRWLPPGVSPESAEAAPAPEEEHVGALR